MAGAGGGGCLSAARGIGSAALFVGGVERGHGTVVARVVGHGGGGSSGGGGSGWGMRIGGTGNG